MNRYLLVFTLLITFLGAKIAFGADEIHWTIMGQNSVTFSWRGEEKNIRYGTKAGVYGQEVVAKTPTPLPFSSSGPFWEAKLTGLEENRVYHYAIGEGPDRTFRTPPPRGKGGFTVYVQGDIGDTDSYFNVGTVQDLIADGSPHLVLAVGDLTYGNAHGQEAVDQHFNDVMVWSQEAAYMPTWGNHEWDKSSDNLRNYKGRFDLPNEQSSPGSPSVSCCGEDWYWFDYGNTRFIAYPEPWSGAWSDWETKAGTLMAEAQSDPAIKFIVTFGHRPAYSSGHHSGSSKLKKILDGLGASYSKYVLNFNGHSHNYERTHPQEGVIHITAGGGGSSLEQDGSCLWESCSKPAWSAFRAMRQGPVRLKFTDKGIQGAFICGPPGGGTNDVSCTLGTVADSFTIGAKANDATPPSATPPNTSSPSVSKDPGTSEGGSSSGTLTFTPSADSYIQPGSSNKGDYYKLWLDSGSKPHEILLKFTVSGVGTGTVANAKLRLYAASGSDKGGDFYSASNNNWSEHKVTWNNAPSAKGSPFASLGRVSKGKWVEIDATSLIKGDGTYSVRIKSSSSDSIAYYAKEQAGFAPKLIVTVKDENTSGNAIDTTPPSATPPNTSSPSVSKDPGTSEGGSSSSTLTFTPSADSYIQPGSSNKGDYYKLWLDSGSKPYEILLKFTVSGVGNGTVTNAKLRLYAASGSDKGGDFYSASNNNWSEHKVTWNNAPSAKGSPFASLGRVSKGKWVEIDATSLIKGDGTYSVRIKSSSSDSIAYYAKEQAGFAPKLIVTMGTGNTSRGTLDNAANSSGDSNDTLAPTVALTKPVGNSPVASTITMEATASDNLAVVGVQFKLNNVNLGHEDTTNTYSYSWDTTTVANGTHTLTAVARDAAGNTATSDPVVVTVNNPVSHNSSPGATNLLTDANAVLSVSRIPEPAYLEPVKDPQFNTKITRISDNSGTAILNINGRWGSDARHHYSKDQPWNSDGTLLALQNSGSPSQIFLDGKTYEPKYARCRNYASYEDRWHPSRRHPHERINLKDSTLNWFDVVNCAETRRWQLPFSGSISEGNTSIDGRYLLVFDTTRMVIVDMDPQAPLASYVNGNKRIGPVYNFSKCGLSNCRPDWVSISPSGKYAVAQYKGDYTRVFDVNPNTLALTPRPMPPASSQCGSGQTARTGYIYNVGHADMTLNPFDNNEDVIVGQHRSWCPSTVNGKAMGRVVMVRLKDNTVTSLTDPEDEGYSRHISTRNYDRPGWAYVSYYPQSGKRFNDEIVAVKLDGSQTVERLAHQHSNASGCYRCEPHAVPSRDGRRVLWASNWALNCGSGCGSRSEIKAYVADTRR
ncbi:CBM96 family carbohydrate-binding protein [Nitrosococcus watsonii]|nr:DNRLRE domain-containing protein [Nitrosococcus watsonii]